MSLDTDLKDFVHRPHGMLTADANVARELRELT
jgi:hypothetical protein